MRVLVLGSGAVGGAVVRRLDGCAVTWTWCHREKDLPGQGLRADFRNPWEPPASDVLIHCAGIAEGSWEDVMAVNVRSAHEAAQRVSDGGHIVLCSALAPGQILPLPPVFAASQGALNALGMALAKQLGPRGVRVNVVSLGLLSEGLSERPDVQALRDDYLAYSALRRVAHPDEVAGGICRFALENVWMSGRVLPLSGGL